MTASTIPPFYVWPFGTPWRVEREREGGREREEEERG
jgi:hypothetical protein